MTQEEYFISLTLFYALVDHVSVLRCSCNNLIIEQVDKARELSEQEYTDFVKFSPFLSPPSRYTKSLQSILTMTLPNVRVDQEQYAADEFQCVILQVFSISGYHQLPPATMIRVLNADTV